MTTYEILNRAFHTGFQPIVDQHDQVAFMRRKKRCCRNAKQIRKECQAIQAATEWLVNHDPTDINSYQNFRSIYRNVSRKKRAIRKMTCGLIGWLKSLLRGKAATKELKKLEAVLANMQKTMRQSNRICRSVTSQIEASEISITNDTLFKQVASEMPEIVVSKTKAKVTAARFGLTAQNSTPEKPFLLQKRGQSSYNVIFPPANPRENPEIVAVDSLLDLPNHLREHHYQSLFNECQPFNSNLRELHRGVVETAVNKLHLDRSGRNLVASYFNPFTCLVENSVYHLHESTTKESVLEWAMQLIRTNQNRLTRIHSCIDIDNPYQIRADFTRCRYIANLTIDSREETYFSHPSLDTQYFNDLNFAINHRVNQEYFNKQKNEGEEDLLIKIGDYTFKVVHRICSSVDESRWFEVYSTSLERRFEQPRSYFDLHVIDAENRERFHHIASSTNLKERLTELIEHYCPYHTCKDFLISHQKREELLEIIKNKAEGSKEAFDQLFKSMTFTLMPTLNRPAYLGAEYYVPGEKRLQSAQLRLPADSNEIRIWARNILWMTNQRYKEIMNLIPKSNPDNIRPDFRACRWKADVNYKGHLKKLKTDSNDGLSQESFQRLLSRINDCKALIDQVEPLS